MGLGRFISVAIVFVFIGNQFFACRQTMVGALTLEGTSSKEEQALWELSTTYLFPQDKEQLLKEVGATSLQIALGKELFFEERLSLNNNQSCNTCHNLDNYGVDNERVSKGSNGALGSRNSPSVFDAAFHFAQFWDGRAKSIEEQAAFPILNPKEMALPNKEMAVRRLRKIPAYVQKFKRAFPNAKDALTFENITRAIGAFERTLVTTSRFDEYTAGDMNALSTEEKRGLKLFLGLNCAPCHSGSTVGGLMPQRFGQVGQYSDYTGHLNSDKGIANLSGQPADENVFKVPSLRNVVHTAPYFHDGSVETLDEAIRIMAKAQLNTALSEEEVSAIKAFLTSLSSSTSTLVNSNDNEIDLEI